MGWLGAPFSGTVTIDGDVTITASGNLLVGSGATVGAGVGVMALANAEVAPTSGDAINGVIFYAQSGHLFVLGHGGTITNVASS